MPALCLITSQKPRLSLAAVTAGVSLVAVMALAPIDAKAQQAADTPLVAPESLDIGLQSAPPSVASISAEDVEQLQLDLQATSDRDLSDALGVSDSFDAEPTPPRTSNGSRGTASPGQQVIRPIDDNPGVGSVSRAQGGLTTFSQDIPAAPASPFEAHSIGGPATGRGSVFLEPNPLTNRQLSPPVFADPTMLPVAPFPTEVQRTVRLRGGSLSGVDAKDLRLRTRQRPIARGLNCSPPDLRLEEIGDPQRPNTYRLTGTIDTPTTGYSYVSQPTDQRNSFIRPTGGPALMAMTLSMKAPELGHHQPDGHVHVREMVTLSPNAKRLDVLVNNIIFRRAQQYYCRVPGTLD